MKYFNTVALFLLLSIGLIFYSCKKDLLVDDSDNGFAIQLRRDTTIEPTRFNWDKANVSSFRAYILVRSNNPIPVGLIPKIGSSDFEIVAEITDRDSLEFSDFNVPITNILHYKLYIDIGNRFIESADIIDYQDLFLFDDFFDFVNIDKDTTWAYLYNSQSGNIAIFDYAHNALVAERILGIFAFGTPIGIASSKIGDQRVLFINDYSSLNKFSLPALDLVKTVSSYQQCSALISNNNGLLFSTFTEYDNSFVTWRQSDITKLKGVAKSNYYEQRILVLLDPASNRVAEASNNLIAAFNINQGTGNISNSKSISVTSNQLLGQMVSSNDYKYFIPNYSGTVYDKDLNLVVSNNISGAIDFAFSDDSKFLFIANSDFTQSPNISKFSFPEMKLIQKVEVPFFQINRIISHNNSVGVIGTDLLTNGLLFKKISFK